MLSDSIATSLQPAVSSPYPWHPYRDTFETATAQLELSTVAPPDSRGARNPMGGGRRSGGHVCCQERAERMDGSWSTLMLPDMHGGYR